MDEQNIIHLQQAGLTEGEAKVYLALAEEGPSQVGPIVKRSKVAYSNVYDVLRRLIEKGLVSFITKNKTKVFHAADPLNLIDHLEKKEAEIEKQKEKIQTLAPNIANLGSETVQEAEVFVGIKGLQTANRKLLAQKGEWLFTYRHSEEYEKESDIFYTQLHRQIKEGGVTMRGISSPGFEHSIQSQNAPFELRTTKTPFPGNLDVVGSIVLQVSWKKPITAILIHSEDIANAYREYFEELWKNAEKVS